MEDVCYFLVGKLEGTRERMKFIFPTYPCLQPSDTVAFRVSLAKYIETLRSSVLHPKGTPTNSSRSRSKGEIVDATAETAWWWKDVIVRKSLLEKCCGERFEKLMLALSTHVLLNEVLKSESHGQLPSDRPVGPSPLFCVSS
ncbi:hypothetical protein CERSUDRAFT_47577 [Gelatoporia subvermispora B]|uniref:HAUS augmin-like complex subunit 6 N-terminal domain-containing protein n=1 Tax=Ceriporiopsis subvermispora (strain B) TaxID=914234 RepID=M2PQY7_CERS8|nr:hypothetical protein CERSUDRAFT_47577 [Gelatoporia subvermispora B]